MGHRAIMTPSGLPRERRTLLLVLGAVGLLLIASLGDSWAYAYLTFPRVYEQNWGRLLRVIGWLPFWLLAGAAFYRTASTLVARRHALILMGAPTLSGAMSELLKLLIRRERPGPTAGAYVFQSFAEHTFSTARFGMPSGDATVAFAACVVAARVWPRARGLWYGLAIGCALARVLSRAHFLSDVTAAAILGSVIADALWRRYAFPANPEPGATAT
jgi:membrane-associated phospholipid phosphatase